MTDPQSVELAALDLEESLTFERDGDTSKLSMNENDLLSTQRWIISSLPFSLISQCIRVALTYRQSTARYEPIVGRLMPNTQMIFSAGITTATENNRPDTITLLNRLLERPAFVNCHVFSEPDNRILTAWWRGGEAFNSPRILCSRLP